MSGILRSLFLSLFVTLAAELLFAYLLRVRRPRDLLVVALVNILTNPIVNYGYYWAVYLFPDRSIYTVLIVALLEVGAVLTEYVIYRCLLSYDRIGKLKLSLLLNAASFVTGLLVSGAMFAVAR